MKILYVAYLDMSEQTGLVRHMTELAAQLKKQGHQVILAVPAIGRYQGCLDLNILYIPVIGLWLLQALSYHFFSWFWLGRLFRTEKPDIIYCNTINFSVTPLLLAKIFGIPHVCEVSGWAGEELLANRRWPRLVCRLAHCLQIFNIRHSAACVAVSGGLAQELQAVSPRVFLMEMGADTEQFTPQPKERCRQQLKLPQDKKIIGYIGGFFPWHGVPKILESAPLVLEKTSDALFVFVGEGPSKQECVRLAKTLNLDSQVLFPGAVPLDESPCWISAFDAGVILFEPVRRDPGSPVKIFEYMATGIPVVASDLAGYGELLRQYQAGIAVKDHHPQTLSEAFIALMEDPEACKTMGAHGRQAVVAHHSWQQNAKRLEKFLREVVG